MTENLSSEEERKQTIAANVEAVKKRIAAAAQRSGRLPSDITLVAVTKTMPPSDINAALACGIDIFGENRVQELLLKRPMIDIEGKQAHIIGHLQSNKVKLIIDKVDLIQSLDSLHLAKEIDRQAKNAQKIMNVLCEVNIGGEESKSGIEPKDLDGFIDALGAFDSLRVLGLMAVPPICDDRSIARHYFSQMRKLFIDIKTKKSDNMNMQVLSMGMSSDFDLAIEEGSTMVRVGTAIFGKR